MREGERKEEKKRRKREISDFSFGRKKRKGEKREEIERK
jgi:hypothetical protein